MTGYLSESADCNIKNCLDLISIITPAWNSASTITECISSVRQQTHLNWEMLVVDDCSSDNTCEVVQGLSSQDDRILLIRQPENGGPARARNAALRHARGRWIAFLDSDDLWLPTKLETQLVFHKAQGAHISFTEYRRISVDSRRTGQLIQVPPRLTYFDLLNNTAIATSTVLVDRQLTGEFEMKPIYYDDFGCWLELLRSGGFAAGLNHDLMRYRVMEGSVSRNKWKSAMEVWKTYRNVEALTIPRSAWHFGHYCINAIKKYRRF
ncbi:glycosyltransferase family 2 protein [Alphaproteobacteria bacterium LSUCC0396]